MCVGAVRLHWNCLFYYASSFLCLQKTERGESERNSPDSAGAKLSSRAVDKACDKIHWLRRSPLHTHRTPTTRKKSARERIHIDLGVAALHVIYPHTCISGAPTTTSTWSFPLGIVSVRKHLIRSRTLIYAFAHVVEWRRVQLQRDGLGLSRIPIRWRRYIRGQWVDPTAWYVHW